MFESLVAFMSALNSVTPLGIIVLLGLVLLFQSKNRRAIMEVSDNHLSGLPDMVDSLKRIENLLQAVNDNTVFIKAKMNGGH